MWKSKAATATVRETQVFVPPPPRNIREYKITSSSSAVRTFNIKEQPSRNVAYRLKFTNTVDWGMVIQEPSINGSNPDEAPVAAAATISIWNDSTVLAIGDPTAVPDTTQRFHLKMTGTWLRKKYEISVHLPPTFEDSESRVLELEWKGTYDVKGFSAKMDRGMHHKLVEKGSNRVLARYVHNFWNLDVAGTLEICADIPSIAPQQWDLFVLLSGMAITERTIKLAMLMMWGIYDAPAAMAAADATAAADAADAANAFGALGF